MAHGRTLAGGPHRHQPGNAGFNLGVDDPS